MAQKIALVTGASSGIGKATAELLARNGYFVFDMARRMDRLEQLRSDQIEPIYLDVTNNKAIKPASLRIWVKVKRRLRPDTFVGIRVNYEINKSVPYSMRLISSGTAASVI